MSTLEKTKTTNDKIRDQVRKLYHGIATSIDPRGEIANILFAETVITVKQKREINKSKDGSRAADTLLNMLFDTYHPNAFIVFKETLYRHEEYAWIAAQIDEGIKEVNQSSSGASCSNVPAGDKFEHTEVKQGSAKKKEFSPLLPAQKDNMNEARATFLTQSGRRVHSFRVLNEEQLAEALSKTSPSGQGLVGKFRDVFRVGDKRLALEGATAAPGISRSHSVAVGIQDKSRLSKSKQQKLTLENLVHGVAVSGSKLCIVSLCSKNIDVYNTTSFVREDKITVDELKKPYDIAACGSYLYVSEYKECIHRIELPLKTHSKWSVKGKYLKLSITPKQNVLVSCYDANKIIEYTPDGKHVREIKMKNIDKAIFGLQHAIQLDDDRFLICYASSTIDRVCIIDSAGSMLKSYGDGPGSGKGQLNRPSYLAIDQSGFIFVADTDNNRIVQFTPSLQFFNTFTSESTGGLKEPSRMNVSMKLLYIAERETVSIFNL